MNHEFIVRLTTSLSAGMLFFGVYYLSSWAFSALLWLILILILKYEWPLLSPIRKKGLTWYLLTFYYPVMPMLCLLWLNTSYYSFNRLIPLYPFIIAWIFDTASYGVGTLMGMHKVAPNISPKKTWEGCAGGCAAVFFAHFYLFPSCSWLTLWSLSATMSFLAFAGDLFESYLKRLSHRKNAGSFLPGHGGLLDRFDSVFFVAYAVALGMKLSSFFPF